MINKLHLGLSKCVELEMTEDPEGSPLILLRRNWIHVQRKDADPLFEGIVDGIWLEREINIEESFRRLINSPACKHGQCGRVSRLHYSTCMQVKDKIHHVHTLHLYKEQKKL